MPIFLAMDEVTTDAQSPNGGNGLSTLRYLVSLLVAGSIVSIALSTQLDGIIAGAAWPVSIGAAVVIGLPVALLMRRWGWRRFYHAIGVGLVLGFIPWGLLSWPNWREMMWPGVAGAGAGMIAWVALRLQTVPLRFLPPKATPFAALGLATATLVLGLATTYGTAVFIFGPPASPESGRTVAAFEVPLPSARDRQQFLDLLQRTAAAEGLHVDAATPVELEGMAGASPATARTIDAAVWRGKKDNYLEASVNDMMQPGFAWITFSRGEDPALAQRFRERVMREAMEQWPGTLSLPIMPTGAIPLRTDLEATPNGYRVKPSAASRYVVSPSGSSIAPEGVSIVR